MQKSLGTQKKNYNFLPYKLKGFFLFVCLFLPVKFLGTHSLGRGNIIAN